VRKRIALQQTSTEATQPRTLDRGKRLVACPERLSPDFAHCTLGALQFRLEDFG
jgi:hypothetical protein